MRGHQDIAKSRDAVVAWRDAGRRWKQPAESIVRGAFRLASINAHVSRDMRSVLRTIVNCNSRGSSSCLPRKTNGFEDAPAF